MNISLKDINSPKDLKALNVNDLPSIAAQVRERIIEVTAKTGGHIAASLGAVEIAVALHYVLDTPEDKLLWDVGHQAYAHKILTGRYKSFETLRQLGGISGFPNKDESPYDVFTIGHSSTSISQALGLACARDIQGQSHNIVAVIGDAALAGGMALEALNNAGHMRKNLTIILNDNDLSITKSVGAINRYLNKIMTNPVYNKVREDLSRLIKRIPVFGFRAFRAARKLEEGIKSLLIPGVLFEELGVRYFGPIDGHDISMLVNTLSKVIKINEPKLIHVITKKGKGYKYAEESPTVFHGAGPFDIETGNHNGKHSESYSDVMGKKITELARTNDKIAVVSAAMVGGTGLEEFARQFPGRTFDVGIAEEHAVTFAGALARGGLKPIVAIYSTFLQRGYDQIIHDVALQNLPVVFFVDRAGIVGEDGPTHHGVFDIAYLRHIPNLVVMAPRDGMELEKMIDVAMGIKGPVVIRYPRGAAESHLPASTFIPVETGKAHILRTGKHAAILAIGSMVSVAIKVSDILSGQGIETYVVNARFVKPLDGSMIEAIAAKTGKIVTLEEGVCDGGFGSAVSEFIARENIKNVRVKSIGLPDQFIEHGRREELFKKYHLTADAIAECIKKELFER